MPLPKQTQDLIVSLQALVYRVRQLKKEREGYSKVKHREIAKLLKEGREDFARIKTEEVIANDNLIAALEILELHSEQLHVRANILDHIASEQKKRKRPTSTVRANNNLSKAHGNTGPSAARTSATERKSGSGWGFWNIFGSSSTPTATTTITAPTLPADGLGDPSATGNFPGELKDNNNEDEPEQQFEIYLDPDLDRSAGVIIYCSARIPRNVPGLLEVRNKLAHRWGNDFANRATSDVDLPVKLPEQLLDRLRVRQAPESLIEAYLKEIARSHRIRFHGAIEDDEDEEAATAVVAEAGAIVAGEEVAKGAIRAESRDAWNPRVSQDDEESHKNPSSAGKSGGIPEMDELARRFAALKK
ncbi:hypothetical protein FQN57_006492 [Myotisia sp. PD_48]|nr:hypothetical protein FQN57_006492 [Myotisia sp. PD_48]